ncbi:MAG TPA: alpha/beta hydrolase [Devosiaceae bacterium]
MKSLLILQKALVALAIAFLVALPGAANALSIMDPFNIPSAMDEGAVQLGKGVAYGAEHRQKLDIYAPTVPSGSAPVVVFIYGGGWDHGDRRDYAFAGRALSAKGFVTVIPDYRLVPEVRYPGFIEDCAAAVAWVEEHISEYGGDPQRVFIMGHSAGAYNAVMLGLDRSFLRQAGAQIPVRGIVGLSGPYDFYPFEFAEVTNAFGTADNPQATQPINLARPDSPPMFLATGTFDPIVKPRNTTVLAEALSQAGATVTTKYYKGLEHMEPVLALGKTLRWRAPVLDDVVEFFTRLGAFDPQAIGAVQLIK